MGFDLMDFNSMELDSMAPGRMDSGPMAPHIRIAEP